MLRLFNWNSRSFFIPANRGRFASAEADKFSGCFPPAIGCSAEIPIFSLIFTQFIR